MNKIILTLLTITLFPGINFGQKVEKNDAEKIALEIYKKNNQGKTTNLKDIIPLGDESKKDTLLYIVPFEESGFAIVSGLLAAPPVLGFCEKGIYEPDSMPQGLLYLLDRYKYELRYIKKENIKPNKEIEKAWGEMLNGVPQKSVKTHVDNFLDTEWEQENGFNALCPNQYPAGCTAVAMAQILRHWECRIDPTGHLCYSGLGYTGACGDIGAQTYNWNNMADLVAENDNQLLVFMAGVSCQTHYNSNNSSSTPGRARDGFYFYWGISGNADVKWRIWHSSTWLNDLKSELDLGRPILYSASALADAHSWVISGYSDNNELWCNWGFGGTWDGLFSLGDFTPGPYGNYNQIESAIFNVYPNQTVGVATPSLTNKSFTYNTNGYVLTIPAAFGATSYQWVTNKGTITGSGTSATLVANSTATVQVRAYNSRCNIYSPYQSATITINYGPITAPNIICYSGSTVSIANVPNTTITWSGTNVSFPNGNTGTSVTVRATSSSTSGNGTITASFTVDGVPKTVSKTVWVGPPSISYISGPYYTPNNQWATYTAQPVSILSAPTDYNWILNPLNSNVVYDYGATADVAFYSLGTYQLVVQAQNTFPGFGPYAVLNGIEVYDSYGLLISPNPTYGETTLTVESASEEKTVDETVSWELDVYDNAQNLKLNNPKVKGKECKFDTSGWKEGIYIVRVKYKDEILTGKLVVKK